MTRFELSSTLERELYFPQKDYPHAVSSQRQAPKSFPSQDYNSWNLKQLSLSNVNKKIRRLLNNTLLMNRPGFYGDQEALKLASTVVNTYFRIMREASLESSDSEIKRFSIGERTTLPFLNVTNSTANNIGEEQHSTKHIIKF